MKKSIIFTAFAFLFLSSIAYAATITSHLELGSSGPDVTTLQNYLIQKGLLNTATGQGTGYFGSLTQSAVETLQTQNNITPTGMDGPTTRNLINSVTGGSQS